MNPILNTGIIISGDLNTLSLKDLYKIRTTLNPFIQQTFNRLDQISFKFINKNQLSLIIMVLRERTVLDRSKKLNRFLQSDKEKYHI